MNQLGQVVRALCLAEERLMAELGPRGHWRGELSSSALATAVACFALASSNSDHHRRCVMAGLDWLTTRINDDGGWGDSPESPSNLSTTLLVWTSLGIDENHRRPAIAQAEAYLRSEVGSLEPDDIAAALLAVYDDDRTFSAPILLMCALGGRLGGPARWDLVPQLPFEVAALPQRLFHWLRLPVVSYAIPALIAIGLARHRVRPSQIPGLAALRNRLTKGILAKLERLQPSNGGFLEAVPLTGFVALSMFAAGRREHAVAKQAVSFLADAQRSDGSWPIDSDLATWVTTLAVKALLEGDEHPLSSDQLVGLESWLLDQQYRSVHPSTGAASGGWAWTDLPGAVPDADDTSGALLALAAIDSSSTKTREAARAGVHWLLGLQNSDGGMPTFCRGWGRLPFDRSCADITAHAAHAMATWRSSCDEDRIRIDSALDRAVNFLASSQDADGAWRPLWFGSQRRRDHSNPVYGTAVVVQALEDSQLSSREQVPELLARGRAWLEAAQNQDGGWGGEDGLGSSLEETALALAALSASADLDTVMRGAGWLARQIGEDRWQAEPIGLYFASLWYSEKLYPVVFTVAALKRVNARLRLAELPVEAVAV